MKKGLRAFLTGILIINGLFLVSCEMGDANTSLEMAVEDGIYEELNEAVIPLDGCAKKLLVKENSYAHFKFTKKQKEYINRMFNDKQCSSISIKLNFVPSEKQQVSLYDKESFPFSFGFLYSKDFDEKGNLNDDLDRYYKNITVQGNARDFVTIENGEEKPNGLVEISMAVSKDHNDIPNIPEGFFVYSLMNTQLLSLELQEAKIGFDRSGNFPVFRFSSNGGIIDASCSSVDFAGGSIIFPAENSKDRCLPEIELKLSSNPEAKSTYGTSVYIKIKAGGEELNINNVKNAEVLTIPVSSLKNRFPKMDIVQNKSCVVSLLMKNVAMPDSEDQEVPVLVPVKCDPGFILSYNQAYWRTKEYEVFQWDRYSEILIFDFKNFSSQDRFFTRLAFFTEKKGTKGTLLTNDEIGSKHGYNAHDYKAEDLANFFNTAVDTNFKLNKEEVILKQLLINNGNLERVGKYVKAVKGGVASVCWEAGSSIRQQLFVHELYHTLFFINENFRNFVAASYYTTFDFDTRQYLIDYFKSIPGLNYDTNDEYLMLNEYMSYILQQKLEFVGTYFASRASRDYVQKYTPVLAQYIIETKGQGFTDAGKMLEEFTFDEFGLKCGIVNLVFK